MFPYVYVLTRSSFFFQSNNYIEVGQNLGLSEKETLFKIILPSARPAIIAGLALVARECLSAFGTVSIFSVSTLTTYHFGGSKNRMRPEIYIYIYQDELDMMV